MRQHRFRVVAGLMAAAALLPVACDADGTAPEPSPTTPEPSPTGLPAGWTLCVNEVAGYAIGYPSDWFTVSTRPENACRWFDRERFTLEEGTEGPATDMFVRPLEQRFEQAVLQRTRDRSARVLLREHITIAGNRALRFEIVQTEELLYPEGTRFYGYLIAFDDDTLVVETISVGGPYEENKEIVDTAARTVRFDVTQPAGTAAASP